MINPFDTVHFPEALPYKTYSYPEFRKKIISIFKTHDLTHVNIKELMSAQQKQDESVLDYMGRVKHNTAKAFPKLADATRQNLAVSMFCRGYAIRKLRECLVFRQRAKRRRPYVLLLRQRPFAREQRFSQRYETSRRWYPANVAVDYDQEGEADEDPDEGDHDPEYDEAEEE